MKYLIHFQATPEAGNRLDSSGGPGKFFGYITERLKPEGTWIDPTQRQGWVVATIDDPVKLAELMMVTSKTLGTPAKCTPVYTLQETAAFAKTAADNARNLP